MNRGLHLKEEMTLKRNVFTQTCRSLSFIILFSGHIMRLPWLLGFYSSSWGWNYFPPSRERQGLVWLPSKSPPFWEPSKLFLCMILNHLINLLEIKMEGPAIVSHDQSWRSGKDYRIFASEKASPDLVNLRNCSCKPSLKIPITSPRYATRLACRNQHWPLNQTCHKNHPHSLNPPSGPNQFQDKPLRFVIPNYINVYIYVTL